ncbi:hypothetical protein SDC9_146839 [bioreactor metagenome]|uniref:Uncharacterized protein n=1 Tax=bioreactor metagenome TaxID=1076179 RepID=A0A645ED69_9ZZZZ
MDFLLASGFEIYEGFLSFFTLSNILNRSSQLDRDIFLIKNNFDFFVNYSLLLIIHNNSVINAREFSL